MRRHIYTLLNEQENTKLEKIIKNAGFKTRTDYFTACALLTIHGENTGHWIEKIRKLQTKKHQLEQTFFDLLTETSFPIIAMKGSETTFRALAETLQKEFFERTGAAVSKDKIKRLIEIYAMIHAPDLQEYRDEICRENFRSSLP